MLKDKLEDLNPIELLLLQRHIKLGRKHLSNYLEREEINQIFSLGNIDPRLETELAADAPEVMGTISLVLNTVFTATLGAWMGISGFLKLSLNKPLLFFSLLAFCILVGAFVGFHNYFFTKKSSEQAIEQRKLKKIEIRFLQILNQKRNKELEQKIQNIGEFLKNLDLTGVEVLNSPSHELNDHEVCLHWLNQVDHHLLQKSPQISQVFSQEIQKFKIPLQQALKIDQNKEKGKFESILYKLADSSVHPKIKPKPWLKSNFRSVLVSVIPVIFGGFSSLFVYFGGAPQIAQAMEQTSLFHFLEQSYVKYFELGIAISITAYFAFSFLHMNHKAFKRDHELEKINAALIKEESDLDLVDEKILKLKHIHEIMKIVNDLYMALKNLANAQ